VFYSGERASGRSPEAIPYHRIWLCIPYDLIPYEEFDCSKFDNDSLTVIALNETDLKHPECHVAVAIKLLPDD
jgi:hypothetical protein